MGRWPIAAVISLSNAPKAGFIATLCFLQQIA
jgi:hypothetical protein